MLISVSNNQSPTKNPPRLNGGFSVILSGDSKSSRDTLHNFRIGGFDSKQVFFWEDVVL